ncbi:MAG: iron-containing alcohol dehydrogenase [Chloroflexi bacterium]|nr:iron-containing alcohol dehydrogenase [Chloroflexota bacterium]
MLSSLKFIIGSGATTFFGAGSIDRLPVAVEGLGQRRAFVVTDGGIAATGILDRAEQILRDAGLESATFDGIRPNPTTDEVDAGGQAVRDFGAAAVVAIGGGSVLDVAKGIALMAANEGPAGRFDYRNQPAQPGVPVVAVPTTAGTGSETNGWGVIEDRAAGHKVYLGHESVAPHAVILDPQLTCGLPPPATAATGADVLAHALESLSSRRSNPYAHGLGLQVVAMVARFLPRAVADGADLEARSQMLLAAHMAGLGFATTGLGLGHAIAHALSARLGAAHGVALAAVLPHVLQFNLPVRTATYAQVAAALNLDGVTARDESRANLTVDAIRRLLIDLGMPGSLREIGCTATLIPQLVRDALADDVIANTPRLPMEEELEALLRAAL